MIAAALGTCAHAAPEYSSGPKLELSADYSISSSIPPRSSFDAGRQERPLVFLKAGMKIKKLELKDGYKRFHHLTIDLGDKPARIIGLVGPNGCGKSSVLDGMLFCHTNQQQMIGNRGGRDAGYHSMHGTDYQASRSILIAFESGDYNQVRNQKAAQGAHKVNTIFSFRSCYRYNNQVKVTESRATAAIALNNYGASVAADLDEKMEDNYRRLHAIFNRYLNEKDVKPSEARAKIIGDLNASLTRCLDLKIQDLGNIEDNQGTLYFKKSDHPKPFEFNVLSAGEKEVVDILLDLYLRRQDFSDTVFLIDERKGNQRRHRKEEGR